MLLLLTALATAMPISDAAERPWNSHFPKGVFHERTDAFVSDWYSKHLVALKEAPLKARLGAEHTTWRFLWLRTWGHPVAVRVEQDHEGWIVHWKQASGQGGYDPGTLTEQGSKRLSTEQVEGMQEKLAAARVKKLPTRIETLGLDGAQWVLEGVVEGDYHLVDRWSPEKGDPYRAACRYLLELTPLSSEPDY